MTYAAVAIAIACVVGMSLVGFALERFGFVRGFYASPYVALVTAITLRLGRIPGYVAAIASALAFNFVFAAPSPTLRMAFSLPGNEELLAYASMLAVVYFVSATIPPRTPERNSGRYTGPLPFVREDEDDDGPRRNFWSVISTGEWSSDNDVGQEYGRIYIDRIRLGAAPLLCWIVRDMIRAGRYSGVEAGFMSAVSAFDGDASYHGPHTTIIGPNRKVRALPICNQ
jgi:hypothetical protein